MKQQSNSTKPPWHTVRRVELDWLRVLAFGILIFYHVGMLYALNWDYHYKSAYSSQFITNIMLWSNQWRMSLLFLISGVAVSYLLQNMPYWRFFRSRHTKVLLPLLFGMTVVVVPQVYIELDSKGIIDNLGYLEFWLAYLDQSSPLFEQAKTVGDYHLTWNHLWFLMYIFSYSLVLWAAYPILNSIKLRRICFAASLAIPKPMLLIGPIICFYLIGLLLWERFPTTHAFWDDWYNHAKSFTCFLLGFALVRSSRLWNAIREFRWPALILALASYGYIVFAYNGGELGKGEFWRQLNGFLWSANGWLWILSIIAWAQHKLAKSNSVLKYLNGGVYCFYIVHQTAIIVLAYFLAPVHLGPVIEPLAIIFGTALICWAGYEIVARLPILCSLFGAKQKKPGGKSQGQPSSSKLSVLAMPSQTTGLAQKNV
ncbi:Peptidoglycan/LPS O-acetylase OafA/YrhL, contains acyltransferase and SGNH-hydrolase domains [Alteromonadaceae bacterium Bs31]|nr:Peptidoglycan/LPS O-acetylase OafA/YrhL, contains acyltransferase and SGNH-hydrolase domains [Alteromonadaceae bacterium Bs31]